MPALPLGTPNGNLIRSGPSQRFLSCSMDRRSCPGGGPFMGTVTMDGGDWVPYQPSTFPTPPFPEYISGHSTFSAAGAEILRRWTRSDNFGASVTFDAGSSTIEPGATPASAITLYPMKEDVKEKNFSAPL